MTETTKPKEVRSVRPHYNNLRTNKRYSLTDIAITLGAGDEREAVKLPLGADENEWIAVQTLEVFNEINLLIGAISIVCTEETCPLMTAGSHYEYCWQDEGNTIPNDQPNLYTKPVHVSAPKYHSLLMQWVDRHLSDEHIFPTTEGVEFPSNFKKITTKIFRRLFRVFAHAYMEHMQELASMGLAAYLNTSAKHFLRVALEFKLIGESDLPPLVDFIENGLRIKLHEYGMNTSNK